MVILILQLTDQELEVAQAGGLHVLMSSHLSLILLPPSLRAVPLGTPYRPKGHAADHRTPVAAATEADSPAAQLDPACPGWHQSPDAG